MIKSKDITRNDLGIIGISTTYESISLDEVFFVTISSLLY